MNDARWWIEPDAHGEPTLWLTASHLPQPIACLQRCNLADRDAWRVIEAGVNAVSERDRRTGTCNCATYGHARLCPTHTQADFDAQDASDVRARAQEVAWDEGYQARASLTRPTPHWRDLNPYRSDAKEGAS